MEHPRIKQAREKLTIPPTSAATSTQEDGSSSERFPRLVSLQELYEVTENQKNLTLFFLFFDCEPMNFQEAMGNKNWKDSMDDVIKAIKKKDTLELDSLLKGIIRILNTHFMHMFCLGFCSFYT